MFGELLAALREPSSGRRHPPGASPRQRRLSPSEVDELVAAYQVGEKVADLAARFGIGRTTVKPHLRRRGVAGRPYRQVHGELLDRARALYAQGWSLRAIEAELGIGREAIRSALSHAGVRLRRCPRHRPPEPGHWESRPSCR